jgi:hypothetical protein
MSENAKQFQNQINFILKKTSSEITKEYNKRAQRMGLTRLGLLVFLTIIVVLCSIALWAWWNNDRCLKKSEEFIASGELYNARQELKKCGWFFAAKKQKVNEELQSAIDKLIDQARHWAELKDFPKAKQYLEIAAKAAENSSQIEEQIKKYDQLEKQWQEELARQKEEQEKQMVLSEKALVAKEKFQKVLDQSLENKADIKAKDTMEIAKNKAQAAENLFSQNQFESAEKQWLSAVEDCKKALKIAETAEITRINKTIVSAFKLKCEQAAASALKINAPAEAPEIWQEAEKIRNSAEQNFTQNDFNAADQLWQQAADKYDEAAKECLGYKKALLVQKRWQNLEQKLSEKEVRAILGSPKCVQAASDRCIWYYQATPAASKNDDGNYECVNPQCGYIRFETVGIETIIEANKKTYQKYIDNEEQAYENCLVSLSKKIQEENNRHESFRNSDSDAHTTTGITTDTRHHGTYNTKSDHHGTYNKRSDKVEVRQNNDAYRAEEQRYESMIQQIKNSKKKEEQRHEKQMGKLSQDLQTKINNLTNGLFPIEPRYIVSDWTLLDQNDLVSLLISEEPNERRIKPTHKWQMPIKWKALRLNIKEEEVYSILGPPQETSSGPGEKVYHYGKITEYGYLTFEECTDSIRRLRCWKEPLWIHVAQELQSERQLSDPNQNINLDEPNKPDANDANNLS